METIAKKQEYQSPQQPLIRISVWKFFGILCVAIFLISLGMVFIPWDCQAVAAPDLKPRFLTLAPEENGFVWFEKAGGMMVDKFPDNPDGSRRDLAGLASTIGSESEAWDPVFAAEVLAANAAVFPELEKGLSCRRYMSRKTDSTAMRLPWLFKNRSLAALLCLKSKQAQLAGDPAGAVKPALQAFRLGQLMADDSGSLIEWSIGITCERLALARLEELAADARTPEPALAKILAELDPWTPAGTIEGYKNAMRCEYEYANLAIKELREGKCRDVDFPELQLVHHIPYLLKPNITLRHLADSERRRINDASLSRSKFPTNVPSKSSYPDSVWAKIKFFARPNSVGVCFFGGGTGGGSDVGSLNKKFRLQAHVMALRLKIKLLQYEKQHGQLPEDLGALVPEFIPAVPDDPADDQPFRYSKEKKRVWSIEKEPEEYVAPCGCTKAEHPKAAGYDVEIQLGTRELKPRPPAPPTSGKTGSDSPF